MAVFKVKAGLHRDLSGKVYKAGQTVESEDDLDKKFVGKFERVEVSRSKKKRRGEKSRTGKKKAGKKRSKEERAAAKRERLRKASMDDERKGAEVE